MKNNSKTFGENIRRIRKAQGLSLDDVADALAQGGLVYSANAIGAWERGERMPSPCVLFNLAHALGCSIYSLFYATSETAQQAAADVAALQERHQRTLVYLAEGWSGDMLPLIETDRAYAMLPPRRRAAAIAALLEQVSESMADGSFGNDLPVNVDAIKEAAAALYEENDYHA